MTTGSLFTPEQEGFALTLQDGRMKTVRPPASVQAALAGVELRPDPRALLERRVDELAARASRTGGLKAFNEVRQAYGLSPVAAASDEPGAPAPSSLRARAEALLSQGLPPLHKGLVRAGLERNAPDLEERVAQAERVLARVDAAAAEEEEREAARDRAAVERVLQRFDRDAQRVLAAWRTARRTQDARYQRQGALRRDERTARRARLSQSLDAGAAELRTLAHAYRALTGAHPDAPPSSPPPARGRLTVEARRTLAAHAGSYPIVLELLADGIAVGRATVGADLEVLAEELAGDFTKLEAVRDAARAHPVTTRPLRPEEVAEALARFPELPALQARWNGLGPAPPASPPTPPASELPAYALEVQRSGGRSKSGQRTTMIPGQVLYHLGGWGFLFWNPLSCRPDDRCAAWRVLHPEDAPQPPLPERQGLRFRDAVAAARRWAALRDPKRNGVLREPPATLEELFEGRKTILERKDGWYVIRSSQRPGTAVGTRWFRVPTPTPEELPPPLGALPFEVLEQVEWPMRPGHADLRGGLFGKLTKLRYRGAVAWVRENVLSDTFLITSNQRLVEKRGRPIKDGEEVLELTLARNAPYAWGELAQLVAASDGLKRRVIPNRQFTPEWAEHHARREAELRLAQAPAPQSSPPVRGWPTLQAWRQALEEAPAAHKAAVVAWLFDQSELLHTASVDDLTALRSLADDWEHHRSVPGVLAGLAASYAGRVAFALDRARAREHVRGTLDRLRTVLAGGGTLVLETDDPPATAELLARWAAGEAQPLAVFRVPDLEREAGLDLGELATLAIRKAERRPLALVDDGRFLEDLALWSGRRMVRTAAVFSFERAKARAVLIVPRDARWRRHAGVRVEVLDRGLHALVPVRTPNAEASAPSPTPAPAPTTRRTGMKRTASAPSPDPEAPYSIAAHKEFLRRLRAGELTADELRATYVRAKAGEAAVRAELGQRPKAELVRGPYASRMTKAQAVTRLWQTILDAFIVRADAENAHYRVITHRGDPAADRERRVAATTDADIQRHAKLIAERVAESQARAEDEARRMNDPQTLEDFALLRGHRGDAALTPELRRRYEALLAAAQREQAEAARQKTVSPQELAAHGWQVVEAWNFKRDRRAYTVAKATRLSGDDFQRARQAAHTLGGRWSGFTRTAGDRVAVPGFEFETREAAEQFLAVVTGQAAADNADELARRDAAQAAARAARLEGLAERIEERAEAQLGAKRKTNTWRRAQQAESAEHHARQELQLASAMERLAAAIQAGQATYLARVSHRTHLETLESLLHTGAQRRAQATGARRGPVSAEDVDFVPYPYPRVYFSELQRQLEGAARQPGFKAAAARLARTLRQLQAEQARQPEAQRREYGTLTEDKDLEALRRLVERAGPHDPHREALQTFDRLQAMGLSTEPLLREALREYLRCCRGEAPAPDPRLAAERALVGLEIDGYFPTPRALAEAVVAKADLRPGQRVLEPSAGKGDLAAAILRAEPGVHLEVIERSPALREVLRVRGYTLVGDDFLQLRAPVPYDRIVMNPPFEGGQDMLHVRHAWEQLAPGGRLVAIMSEGPFFRADARAQAFRTWLKDQDGASEKNPEGSFLASDRPTGVATRTVVMEKPADCACKHKVEDGATPSRKHKGEDMPRGKKAETRPSAEATGAAVRLPPKRARARAEGAETKKAAGASKVEAKQARAAAAREAKEAKRQAREAARTQRDDAALERAEKAERRRQEQEARRQQQATQDRAIVARMRAVDPLTGVDVSPDTFGAELAGGFVARVPTEHGAQLWGVAGDDLDMTGARFPVKPEARPRIREEAAAFARASERRPTPRLKVTPFRSVESAIREYMTNNGLYRNIDLAADVLTVREWMSRVEVRRGKRHESLESTAVGQRIARLWALGPRPGVTAALRWIFGQAKARRWDQVPWNLVDDLEAVLRPVIQRSAAAHGMSVDTTTPWRPQALADGGLPEPASFGRLDPEQQAAVRQAYDGRKFEAAARRSTQALRDNAACLRPEVARMIKLRIATFRKMAREPWRAPEGLCGPDDRYGGEVCSYDPLEQYLQELEVCCKNNSCDRVVAQRWRQDAMQTGVPSDDIPF